MGSDGEVGLGAYVVATRRLGSGVALIVDEGPAMLFAHVSNVSADGDGHMRLWSWKGAAALKPCVKHGNVVKKAARPKPGSNKNVS